LPVVDIGWGVVDIRDGIYELIDYALYNPQKSKKNSTLDKSDKVWYTSLDIKF